MTAWLLAFLAHSALWCGLAWLWTRLRPSAHARAREMVWCTAIAASFITPTAQLFTPPGYALWRLPAPSALALAPEAEHAALGDETHGGAREHAAADAAFRVDWRAVTLWGCGGWAAVAGALLLRHRGRLSALRRRIGRRGPVRDGRALGAFAQLSRKAGLPEPPRLTQSENLGSPIAIGLGRRREICLPTRALRELDHDQLRAMLGHELAHHLRRDPLRLGALHALQAVFFFQPMFRLALRSVRLAAEEQCDEWAARQLGDRLAMASCLAEVAGWVLRQDRRIPVPCMARRCSSLGARVDRLLDARRGAEAPKRARGALVAVGFLAMAPWVAPAVAPGGGLGGEWGGERLGRGEHERDAESAHEEHHDQRLRDVGAPSVHH